MTSSPAGTAFYLLKPDALGRDDITRRAAELLGDDLKITEQRDLVLTAGQVSALWADHRSELRPIASRFLGLYLVGHTCRLVTVHGPAALDGVKRLKRQLRREHAQGAFANVVHAPSTEYENQAHTAILTAADRPGQPTPWPADPPPRERGNPPASCLVLSQDPAQVRAAVDAVWVKASRHGWACLSSPPDRPGRATVWLVGDDHHSIDSAVSALWQSLPHLTLQQAIELVCDAERAGRTMLASGPAAAMTAAARRLRAHRLQADITLTSTRQP